MVICGLTVVTDARQISIEAVVNKYDGIRNLLYNSWVQLWRFGQEGGLQRYMHVVWLPLG